MGLADPSTSTSTSTSTSSPEAGGQASRSASGSARLVAVAHFDHQVTGVTMTPQGRLFVNFPRWAEDAPVSVAEVLPDGELRPYPDAAWNEWRNSRKDELTPDDHWVCVQSVVSDGKGQLWVIDPAAPAQDRVVPGGPKLVQIDTATDRVVRTIAFDESIAPQGSYLNDVRLGQDGRFAFLTDSGARGAIVVVDLADGSVRRALDGRPSTQFEKGVQVHADGQVLRRTDGRGVEFSADGIALSPQGDWLYWQAVKGRTLYRVPTASLTDASLAPDALAGQVERVAETCPADGLLMDAQGRLYLTAVEENAVKVLEGGQLRTLVQDERLRWPDTFAQGPDGTVYVTASRIPDMHWFKPGNPLVLPTTLFRIES